MAKILAAKYLQKFGVVIENINQYSLFKFFIHGVRITRTKSRNICEPRSK